MSGLPEESEEAQAVAKIQAIPLETPELGMTIGHEPVHRDSYRFPSPTAAGQTSNNPSPFFDHSPSPADISPTSGFFPLHSPSISTDPSCYANRPLIIPSFPDSHLNALLPPPSQRYSLPGTIPSPVPFMGQTLHLRTESRSKSYGHDRMGIDGGADADRPVQGLTEGDSQRRRGRRQTSPDLDVTGLKGGQPETERSGCSISPGASPQPPGVIPASPSHPHARARRSSSSYNRPAELASIRRMAPRRASRSPPPIFAPKAVKPKSDLPDFSNFSFGAPSANQAASAARDAEPSASKVRAYGSMPMMTRKLPGVSRASLVAGEPSGKTPISGQAEQVNMAGFRFGSMTGQPPNQASIGSGLLGTPSAELGPFEYPTPDAGVSESTRLAEFSQGRRRSSVVASPLGPGGSGFSLARQISLRASTEDAMSLGAGISTLRRTSTTGQIITAPDIRRPSVVHSNTVAGLETVADETATGKQRSSHQGGRTRLSLDVGPSDKGKGKMAESIAQIGTSSARRQTPVQTLAERRTSGSESPSSLPTLPIPPPTSAAASGTASLLTAAARRQSILSFSQQPQPSGPVPPSLASKSINLGMPVNVAARRGSLPAVSLPIASLARQAERNVADGPRSSGPSVGLVHVPPATSAFARYSFSRDAGPITVFPGTKNEQTTVPAPFLYARRSSLAAVAGSSAASYVPPLPPSIPPLQPIGIRSSLSSASGESIPSSPGGSVGSSSTVATLRDFRSGSAATLSREAVERDTSAVSDAEGEYHAEEQGRPRIFLREDMFNSFGMSGGPVDSPIAISSDIPAPHEFPPSRSRQGSSTSSRDGFPTSIEAARAAAISPAGSRRGSHQDAQGRSVSSPGRNPFVNLPSPRFGRGSFLRVGRNDSSATSMSSGSTDSSRYSTSSAESGSKTSLEIHGQPVTTAAGASSSSEDSEVDGATSNALKRIRIASENRRKSSRSSLFAPSTGSQLSSIPAEGVADFSSQSRGGPSRTFSSTFSGSGPRTGSSSGGEGRSVFFSSGEDTDQETPAIDPMTPGPVDAFATAYENMKDRSSPEDGGHLTPKNVAEEAEEDAFTVGETAQEMQE